MSDRWVFLAAFLTVVLVVASAFAIPQLFVYELLTSTIFMVVAVMVFFGEDKFSYMLGMIAPVVWFVFGMLTGGFFGQFGALVRFISGKPSSSFETPLHACATLAALALIIFSARVWRKQVTEKFLGKTFTVAIVVSVVWCGILYFWQFAGGGRPH
jgi:hypothetical protein